MFRPQHCLDHSTTLTGQGTLVVFGRGALYKGRDDAQSAIAPPTPLSFSWVEALSMSFFLQ